jgi:hypothetical protein
MSIEFLMQQFNDARDELHTAASKFEDAAQALVTASLAPVAEVVPAVAVAHAVGYNPNIAPPEEAEVLS